MAKFKHRKRIAKLLKKTRKAKTRIIYKKKVETVTQKLKFNENDLTRKTNVSKTTIIHIYRAKFVKMHS